jgi:cytochrome d ubiquinol oxidase subunit I
MDSLTAARAQMELSLAFHMVFAALAVGLPPLMLGAEAMHLRTGKAHYLALAKTWSKAAALLFVIGAVSGTALSFELGLLWPRFMRLAGPVIGPAFALEGFAFFLEAIFVGLYLYGWDRLTPRQHFLCGLPVAFFGMLSGVLVVGANAWMQAPRGFLRIEHGAAIGVDPLATFRNPAWPQMALHSTLSCYVAVGFLVAGVYAVSMLRGRRDAYVKSALSIAMALGTVAAVLQPLSGDRAAKAVAVNNPAKLAAMEAHFETSRGAPLLIGGIPDPAHERVDYAIRVPRALSFLAHGDFDAEVTGLHDVPADERPNVVLCHFAFQTMVFGGMACLGVGALFQLARWRGRRRALDVLDMSDPRVTRRAKWLVWCVALVSPLGVLALEAGWIVTEAGRQPWVIYKVMRTRDAVTPVADVALTFWTFGALYVGLAIVLIALLRRLAHGATGDPHQEAESASASSEA